MNTETINRASASLYRQLGLMRLLGLEYEFFKGTPMPSKFKNIMFRGQNSYKNCITELKLNLPIDHAKVDRLLNENEEKLFAIANIVEKLFALDTEQVLGLENDFEAIQINYEA